MATPENNACSTCYLSLVCLNSHRRQQIAFSNITWSIIIINYSQFLFNSIDNTEVWAEIENEMIIWKNIRTGIRMCFLIIFLDFQCRWLVLFLERCVKLADFLITNLQVVNLTPNSRFFRRKLPRNTIHGHTQYTLR